MANSGIFSHLFRPALVSWKFPQPRWKAWRHGSHLWVQPGHMECPGHPPAPGDWDRARPMGCQWNPQILVDLVGLWYPAGDESLAGIKQVIFAIDPLITSVSSGFVSAHSRSASHFWPASDPAQRAVRLLTVRNGELAKFFRDRLGKHSRELARWAMSPSKHSKMCPVNPKNLSWISPALGTRDHRYFNVASTNPLRDVSIEVWSNSFAQYPIHVFQTWGQTMHLWNSSEQSGFQIIAHHLIHQKSFVWGCLGTVRNCLWILPAFSSGCGTSFTHP